MPARVAALALVVVLVTTAWLRLERGGAPLGDILLVLALAVIPGLALALGRSRRVVVTAAAGSALVAASAAFHVSLGDARIWERDRDFVVPVVSAFKQGVLEFFDARVPFNPVDYPLMHGVVLLAVFGFVAFAGLAIAARRPLLAVAALVVGVGWPATMASTWVAASRPLATGALTLAAVLALLVLVDGRRRALVHAAAVALALVAVSVTASTSDAVAKRAFVHWQSWDLYDRPEDPVSVSYVWDANYEGIDFPKKKTVVLRIRVPGPRRALYWRATTLDDYTGSVWKERLEFTEPAPPQDEIDVTQRDPLLPRTARSDKDWVRQEVEVVALRDSRLVASAQTVKWEPGTSAEVSLANNGTVVVEGRLRQGQRYTAWSHIPDAKPAELREAPAEYPEAALPYLAIARERGDFEALPAFGTPGRDIEVRAFLEQSYFLDDHELVYELAKTVTTGARSPYEAAVMLEAWFRGRDGGFVYDESPPRYVVDPPLLGFLRDKRGYCQQFAGAMALMLRFLGVPARVAAGFTSGTYDDDKDEWTVTDHNAHTWVEVYFPRFGWIPFDPTPNRGQLTATYSPFSNAFDSADAARVLGAAALRLDAIRSQIGTRAAGLETREPDEVGGGGGVPAAVADKGGSLLGLLLLVAAIGAAAILVLKAAVRRARLMTRDPRAVAAACRRDVIGFVADQRVDVAPSATLTELGAVVESTFVVNAGAFVRAVTQAAYARPEEARRAAAQARRELRRLRRRLSTDLGLSDRVRGALSLRSLAA